MLSTSFLKWRTVYHELQSNKKLLTHSVKEHIRQIHKSGVVWFLDVRDKDHEKKEKQIVIHQGEYFNQAASVAKNKEKFYEVIQFYLKHNTTYRRGHVEFIYAAMNHMKDFKTNRDLETYKKLVDLFPKEKMVPRNIWQVEFMHYPKQQQCCIDILDHMEENGVIPDDDMGYLLRSIFGDKSHAFRKYQRMMFWMPKFRYSNPYYVPYDLPTDRIDLAKLALKRMAVDLENEISVFMSEELPSGIDQTFIVSSQSPTQRQLISEHAKKDPIFVEGGFTVWMRSEALTYFVLRSESTERFQCFDAERLNKNNEEVSFKWSIFEEESPKSLSIPPSLHEQADGTILGMCITGTSSKDSLVSWIKFLEAGNRNLTGTPVIFKLRTPEADLEIIKETEKISEVIT